MKVSYEAMFSYLSPIPAGDTCSGVCLHLIVLLLHFKYVLTVIFPSIIFVNRIELRIYGKGNFTKAKQK